jgi:AraC-like DNA-binding protein
MNEKENTQSVLDANVQSTASESLIMDSIETPVDVLRCRSIQGVDLPFVARSTGKYREGRGFFYYREGINAYCFFMTVSGVGEFAYRGVTKRMERGDMVFVSSALPAHIRNLNDDWRFCFVNVEGSACPCFEELWNGGGCTVIRPRDASHFTDLLDRITAELGTPSAATDLTVNLLITTLLTDALKEKIENETPHSSQQYPVWVREASVLLSEKCAEELRISDMASRFYMEQNNFIRRFKRYMGKTPKEYQIVCRMERATTLLSESDLSLSEIAARCGFASHSFFSKTFRRLYGITPTQYRLGLSNS